MKCFMRFPCKTSLYAASNILNGEVIGRITQRHRAKEFLDFLRQIDRETPKEQDLHLILDNSSTHKTPKVKAWLEKHPRFRLHFPPDQWPVAECRRRLVWPPTRTTRVIPGHFTSVDDLKTAIRQYIKVHNEKLGKV